MNPFEWRGSDQGGSAGNAADGLSLLQRAIATVGGRTKAGQKVTKTPRRVGDHRPEVSLPVWEKGKKGDQGPRPGSRQGLMSNKDKQGSGPEYREARSARTFRGPPEVWTSTVPCRRRVRKHERGTQRSKEAGCRVSLPGTGKGSVGNLGWNGLGRTGLLTEY